MNKLFALAASLVAFTGIVNADYGDAQMRNLENRITVLEQKKGCNGMINPSARPTIDDGVGLYFSGDFLYWRCHENGVGYVIKNGGSYTGIAGSSGQINGQIKNIRPEWRPGFRIGVGYNTMHDGWDLYATWTRYTTHSNPESAPPVGGTLIPTFINPTNPQPTGTLVEASGRWNLQLNVIDLEMGREFFVSRCMTLRPFFGLRSAWIGQDLKLKYNYLSGGSITIDNPKLGSNFWGIGLMGGLDTEWKFCQSWSIFANGDLALLYGYYSIHNKEFQTTSTAKNTILKVNDRPRIGRAIADLAAGLRWEESFSCDSFRVRVQGGWEQHMYFGQNQYDKFVDSVEQGIFVSNQGDISFEGWVLNAQIDF